MPNDREDFEGKQKTNHTELRFFLPHCGHGNKRPPNAFHYSFMKLIGAELLTIRFRFLKKQAVVILSKPQADTSNNANKKNILGSYN